MTKTYSKGQTGTKRKDFSTGIQPLPSWMVPRLGEFQRSFGFPSSASADGTGHPNWAPDRGKYVLNDPNAESILNGAYLCGFRTLKCYLNLNLAIRQEWLGVVAQSSKARGMHASTFKSTCTIHLDIFSRVLQKRRRFVVHV